ncbi:hypothetical protein CsatA_005293 [Cannabis sativa]
MIKFNALVDVCYQLLITEYGYNDNNKRKISSSSPSSSSSDQLGTDHNKREISSSSSSSSSDHHKSNKKPRKIKIPSNAVTRSNPRGVVAGPNPPPPLSLELIAAINGSIGREQQTPLLLIYQKKLFESDLKKQANRLSMPVNQIVSDDFLNEEEKEKVQPKTKGLIVRVIEPNLQQTTLVFKQWTYPKKNKSTSPVSYVFNKNWFSIVDNNGLKPNHILQVWFFRDIDRNPCFAFVNLGFC